MVPDETGAQDGGLHLKLRIRLCTEEARSRRVQGGLGERYEPIEANESLRRNLKNAFGYEEEVAEL